MNGGAMYTKSALFTRTDKRTRSVRPRKVVRIHEAKEPGTYHTRVGLRSPAARSLPQPSEARRSGGNLAGPSRRPQSVCRTRLCASSWRAGPHCRCLSRERKGKTRQRLQSGQPMSRRVWAAGEQVTYWQGRRRRHHHRSRVARRGFWRSPLYMG